MDVELASHNRYLYGDIISTMHNYKDYIRTNVEANGLRYSHATSIAPTGTISLISNNVSNGIEPPFSAYYTRNITDKKDANMKISETVMDYAFMLEFEKSDMEIEDFSKHYSKSHKFAMDISPSDHIRVQAAAQKYIDSSISKTVNCSADMKFEDFKNVYLEAYDKGLKGLATFRPNHEVRSAILMTNDELDKMTIKFTMEDGTTSIHKGSDKLPYNGKLLTAFNIYDMLK